MKICFQSFFPLNTFFLLCPIFSCSISSPISYCPAFFLQRKILIYFLLILLLLAMIYQLRPFDQLLAQINNESASVGGMGHPLPPVPAFRPAPPGEFAHPPLRRIDAISIFLFVMIFALSMAVRMSQEWRIYPGWYSGRATDIHLEVFITSVLKKLRNLHFQTA